MPDLSEANLRDVAAAAALLRRVLSSLEEHHSRINREEAEQKAALIAQRTQIEEPYEETYAKENPSVC
jgi:hypothetical protein